MKHTGSQRILMFASCYGRGLTQQCTEQSIAFARRLSEGYCAVADPIEQFPGLYDRLRSENVAFEQLDGLDTHKNFSRLRQQFHQITTRFTPTAVIAHTNWQFAIASAARRRSKVGYHLVYVHNGYRHNRPLASIVARFLITWMLRCNADLVIAPSKHLYKTFHGLRAKTVIVPLGQDEHYFANPVEWSSSGKSSSFVFGGEFRKGKNQGELISVFERFARQSGMADWKLYLPGEGQLLEKCRQQAAQSQFSPNIILPGFMNRAQMLDLYDRCEFAVVPTNSETFGHCIVEPFIRGRVVLSRPVGVAPDLIRHMENGLLFGDWDILLSLLQRVVPDQSLCQRIARMAFSERDKFRWGTICDALLISLEDLQRQYTAKKII